MMEFTHKPVLLDECMRLLDVRKAGVFIDATIGGGGHTDEIFKRSAEDSLVIGIDRDMDAITHCLEKFSDNDRLILFNENFDRVDEIAQKAAPDGVDGIFADFGVSSYQLDSVERGFSFMRDERLDMRMNKNQELDAWQVVNNLSAEDLSQIFREFGEERKAWAIARKIVKRRTMRTIDTTLELADIVKSVNHGGGRIHPATRAFQAIRIYVNDELGSIERFLNNSLSVLKPGGRLVCISFHSLEDRIVKKFFRFHEQECLCPPESPKCTCNHRRSLKILTRKPIIASEDEKKDNIRSRSARLRGALRL